MPAKDKYHDVMVRALKKDVWMTFSQYELLVGDRHLWVDIYAQKQSQNIAVLIEVKGFENTPSPVDYLASAIGQYVLYRAIIESSASPVPLYMAVPEAAYTGILQERIGELAIRHVNIKLVLFDVILEEVILWIP